MGKCQNTSARPTQKKKYNMASDCLESMEALNELVVVNTMIDNRMSSTKMKIIMKRQEIIKIGEEIRKVQADVNKLDYELINIKSQEMKAMKNIQGLQQSKSMFGHLQWNFRNQLSMFQDNYKKIANNRNKIMEKYSKVCDSYLAKYKSLRSSNERTSREMSIKLDSIKLKQERHRLQQYKRKVDTLKKMSELIFRNKIVKLAELMVLREKTTRNVILQMEINKKLEEEMLILSKKKQEYLREQKEQATNKHNATMKKAPLLTHVGNLVHSLASPTAYTSIKERLGILLSFSRPSNVSHSKPEVKEHKKSLVGGLSKEEEVCEPVETKFDEAQTSQPAQMTEEHQEKPTLELEPAFKEQAPVQKVKPVKPAKKIIQQKRNPASVLVKSRSKQQRKVTFTAKPSKIAKDPDLAETRVPKQQDILENPQPCVPEKMFAEFSPKASSTQKDSVLTPEIFSSLYNFPSGSCISVISPPSFQPVASTTTEKDFSALFGGSSQQTTDSSFFNLF